MFRLVCAYFEARSDHPDSFSAVGALPRVRGEHRRYSFSNPVAASANLSLGRKQSDVGNIREVAEKKKFLIAGGNRLFVKRRAQDRRSHLIGCERRKTVRSPAGGDKADLLLVQAEFL